MTVACFTFDNMGEASDVGSGRLSGPLPEGEDPSLAIGYPALFELLERRGVRATFFIEGWNGVHHPEAVRAIVVRGHELGMHGWTHEPWETLDVASERALATRATEALAARVRRAAARLPRPRRPAHGADRADPARS